jgi:hypothetical protein
MTRVTVVFTEHEERGLTTATGLLAILDQIRPEVIFLECPLASFESYLSGAHATLEPTAVLRYREVYPAVDLIPVDAPTPDASLFADFRDLISRVALTGPEYDRVASWHRQYVVAYGFAYLNSQYCSDIISQQHEAILAGIATLADQRLAECYELWTRTNRARDLAMVSNIADHCRHCSFSRAAFLVGAAHRQAIIDLSTRDPGALAPTIQWDFDSFRLDSTHGASA